MRSEQGRLALKENNAKHVLCIGHTYTSYIIVTLCLGWCGRTLTSPGFIHHIGKYPFRQDLAPPRKIPHTPIHKTLK